MDPETSADRLRSICVILFGLGSKHPAESLDHHFTKATKVTYNFCEELFFPGAEFVRRKKRQGFEMGGIGVGRGQRISVVDRGYRS